MASGRQPCTRASGGGGGHLGADLGWWQRDADPQCLSPGKAVPALPGLSLALFPPSPPHPPPHHVPHQNTPLYKSSQQPSGAESATNPNGQRAHQVGGSPQGVGWWGHPIAGTPMLSLMPSDGWCSPACRSTALEGDSPKQVARGHQAAKEGRASLHTDEYCQNKCASRKKRKASNVWGRGSGRSSSSLRIPSAAFPRFFP